MGTGVYEKHTSSVIQVSGFDYAQDQVNAKHCRNKAMPNELFFYRMNEANQCQVVCYRMEVQCQVCQ